MQIFLRVSTLSERAFFLVYLHSSPFYNFLPRCLALTSGEACIIIYRCFAVLPVRGRNTIVQAGASAGNIRARVGTAA